MHQPTHPASSRSIPEHLAALLDLAAPATPRRLPLEQAEDLVIAADVRAELAVPPFSNSAVDGFLLRDGDLQGPAPWLLPVAAEVPAGALPQRCPPGQALRIMTGAPVGDPVTGGLRVIPVEDTDIPPGPVPLPGQVKILRFNPQRRNIRARGEDIGIGDPVTAAGSMLGPGTLAALVSTGIREISAFPRPRVSLISSGDELVPPGHTPGPGQLPDSNLPMLGALLRQAGISRIRCHRAPDDPAAFRGLLDQEAAGSDLLITTGGVSVGAFDVVREVAGEGPDPATWFGTVDMQPGKPQGMARWAGVPLVCLPGNPVAVFVSHHLFLTPLLRALSGHSVDADPLARPRVTARPIGDFPRAGDRPLLVPVRLEFHADGAVVSPFTGGGRGSHRVASLAGVNGLVIREPGDLSAPDSPLSVLILD